MRIVLNNINDISLSNISIYKNRIYYSNNDIRLNGIYFGIQKNMIPNENRYIVYFNRQKNISQLNDYFKSNHKSFLKDNGKLYIEVIKNSVTESIFHDNESKICINVKSINDNNYPKIHILPWIAPI
jgi:sucrose-6-phosphate hydrolase SacC (GH32 family)